jgi:hypothetical protein
LEVVILANLVPSVGGRIRRCLNDVLKNTGQLGTVGAALLLRSTIEVNEQPLAIDR